MSRRAIATAVVATLVILAGCLGGSAGGPGVGTTSPPTGTDVTTPTDGSSGETGAVHFYVSDEPNAIEDFDHLNVSISAVGLHRVDGGATETATPTPANGTRTPANGTATPGDEADAEEDETEGGDGREGDAEWVEYEVNGTVDLTELVGANATKLDVLEAPAGTYDEVFVYVEEIDAVLENGEAVNVKLPSEKLHIDKRFEVGDGESVEFVFDISVHKAGKSGKYILKPVVSQSGTDDEVEIDESGGEDDGNESDEGEDERGDREEIGDVEAEFVGPADPGGEATVKVTGRKGPLAGLPE